MIDIKVIANPIPDETVLSLPIAARAIRRHPPLLRRPSRLFPQHRRASSRSAARWCPPRRVRPRPGRSPSPARIRAISCATSVQQHGLHLIENPPHLPDLLAAAGYAPIPLRFGGGTRIKVLRSDGGGTGRLRHRKGCRGTRPGSRQAFPVRQRRRRACCENRGPRRTSRKRPPRWPAPAGPSCATGIRSAAIEQTILHAVESLRGPARG